MNFGTIRLVKILIIVEESEQEQESVQSPQDCPILKVPVSISSVKPSGFFPLYIPFDSRKTSSENNSEISQRDSCDSETKISEDLLASVSDRGSTVNKSIAEIQHSRVVTEIKHKMEKVIEKSEEEKMIASVRSESEYSCGDKTEGEIQSFHINHPSDAAFKSGQNVSMSCEGSVSLREDLVTHSQIVAKDDPVHVSKISVQNKLLSICSVN